MRIQKRRIYTRGLAAALVAACLFCGTPVQALAAYSTDTDGVMYAQDDSGFVCAVESGAQTASVYMYGGTKAKITLPVVCEDYAVTTVGSTFSQVILKKLKTVTIPSGYTKIAARAFQNQTSLYRIEIPASVTSIGKNVFSGCNLNKLTIVTPYGSAAEKYAKKYGIHYTNTTALTIQYGYGKMFVGESRQIAVLNNSKKVTWKSTDSSVLSVDKNGNITAKKAGYAKITATIGGKTYTYPHTVVARTQSNVLDIIWNEYVTSSMSDYEKAVAAQQWCKTYIAPTGTSVLAQKALEKGKSNYRGFCDAYGLILEHYGMSVKTVTGETHMENSVVIAGTAYTASSLSSASGVDKKYTTVSSALSLNKCTMTLSVGATGKFKLTGATATWSSSEKSIATVNKKGKVTAKGAGTATITMKADGVTYACTVRVNP